jgi:uncharacterized protein YjbI with pentapeptide repeats
VVGWALALAGVVVTAAFVGLAYARRWAWTGFTGAAETAGHKTLWDWLQLFVIPVAVAGVAFALNAWQSERAQRRASDDRRDEILRTYLDDMSTFMLQQRLLHASDAAPVRTVARTVTLTALRRLDPARRSIVVRFLYESRLMRAPSPIVDLRGADLRGVSFRDEEMTNASFAGARLDDADFRRATLISSSFDNAALVRADFREALLLEPGGLPYRSFERGIESEQRKADQLRLEEGKTADDVRTRIIDLPPGIPPAGGVNFSGAQLRAARFDNAVVHFASFEAARLVGASFIETSVPSGNFFAADLRDANFSRAYLRDSRFEDACLRGARFAMANLHDATMPARGDRRCVSFLTDP